jgi:acetolactate synthase-1/2/3 large subunit
VNGADVLIARLFHQGVRVIFGMPGSHSTAIYDAIARHGGIRTILARNEQAAAFMADGYARSSDQPGVVCTTAGPGATNALTGIAEAWADSIPLLLISGQVNSDRLHQECGNYHEIDLESIFTPCTKYCATVLNNDHIIDLVDRAFVAMTSGRQRPAALFLPQDLMARTVRESAVIGPTLPEIDISFPETDIQKGAELLMNCVRPVVLAGGGAVAAEAGSEIERLAKKLDCPVITTLNGKGILDERGPVSMGHARSPGGKLILDAADGMLALGCRFTEVFTGFRTMKVPRRLVQVDIDKSQIGMNYPVEIGIVADCGVAARALNGHVPDGRTSGWGPVRDAARAAKPAKPEWLIESLRAELPENAIVFTDASEMAYRMHTEFVAYRPRTFFYPSNYITLGWGFPAALGAAAALGNRSVVSLSGDGGFVMTAQELATAARYRLKVIAIIHNDSTYGAIKNLQMSRHQGRVVDTELNNPDFVNLAEAFGVPAVRTPDSGAFIVALRHALNREGPSVIEVPGAWRNLR